MAGYNSPYAPLQPTADDLVWEAQQKKWQEEEDLRNAAEDAAILRSGGKLPGTWDAGPVGPLPSSAETFSNAGLGFFHPDEKGAASSPQREYRPPESGYYDRAKAELARQQADTQKYHRIMAGPQEPRPPDQAQENALATLDMFPAHASGPVGPEMAPAHAPGSPYKETVLRNYTQDDYNVGAAVGAENYGEHKPYFDRTDILSLPNQWGINKAWRSPTAERTDLPKSQIHGTGTLPASAEPGLESRFGDELTGVFALLTAGVAPTLMRGAAGLGGIPKEAVLSRLAKVGINERNISKRMPGLSKKLEGGWLQKILGGSEVYPSNLRAYAGAQTRAGNAEKMARNYKNIPVAPTPMDALSKALKKVAAQKTTKSVLPYQVNQADSATHKNVAPSFWEHLNELVPIYNDTPFGVAGP